MDLTCQCVGHGCGALGGVKLKDHRTFRAHAIHDQAALAKQVQERAEEAVQDEIDRITIFMASTTLSDRADMSSAPNNRLWSRESLEDEQVSVDAEPVSQSRQDAIRSVLATLNNKEKDIDALSGKVESALLSFSPEVHAMDAFPFRRLEAEGHMLQMDLSKVVLKAAPVTVMKESLEGKISGVMDKLNEARSQWRSHRKAKKEELANAPGVHYSTDSFYSPILPGADPILQLAIFFVVVARVILHNTRTGCTFMLGLLQYIVQNCLMRYAPTLSPREQKVLHDFPCDPRTLDGAFDIDPKTIIYAVCPSKGCQRTHAPKFVEGSPIPIYNSRCRNRINGHRCNTQLLRPRTIGGRTIFSPIKPFVFFTPADFLGRMLARPGLEAQMDQAWDRTDSGTPFMQDVFDGDVLKNFKGPDGRRHFRFGGDEGRYVWSLSLDFCNPLSNKQAGKKISIGVISMVCLNLPPHLRYKPENIFLVGVIPGPHEPGVESLNHFLRPLVDHFLTMWNPGIRFSRTDGHPHGRLVRCAIVCVICDLPAARKTGGFGAINHTHFCSACRCSLKTHGYNNIDIDSWQRRTNQDCRRAAKEFRRGNRSTKDSVLASTGVRWTELLRLPYFDPSRFLVVDAMHNLFLGLIQEHFMGILGLHLPKDKSVSPRVLVLPISEAWTALSKNEQTSARRIIRWLESPMTEYLANGTGARLWYERFSKQHHSVMQLFCSELSIKPIPTDNRKVSNFSRADFARGLLAWRAEQVEDVVDPQDCLLREELEQIRDDITNLVRPSWLTSVPANLGSASHGKLKADQWRALGTTFLPLSLIRLWARLQEDDERSVLCDSLLSMTMSLVSAVIIATSRSTSTDHAEEYKAHMVDYLTRLKQLFPKYKLRPNHHMALHLYEYIQFYGPVHAWWTFPFERVIGMLQRITTNYKPGEYEATISQSFVRSNNLRKIMKLENKPKVLSMIEPLFDKLVQPQARDTLMTDILSLATHHNEEADLDLYVESPPNYCKALPDALAHSIRSTFGKDCPTVLLSSLMIEGVRYSTSSQHLGNSLFLLKSDNAMSHLPARIDYIVQVAFEDQDEPVLMTFVAARRFEPAEIDHDPFAECPFLRAQLWNNKVGRLELFPLDSVLCHFAQLPIKWEDKDCMVIVSLSRNI